MFNRSIVFAAFVFSLMLGSIASAADAYKVDPVHSAVVFRIGHFNVGQVYGRFNLPENAGSFTIDAENPENNAFEIVIEADKIDTGNAKRDDHLRSADFFNVKQFPQITFKSTSVKSAGENVYDVSGDLTLHGVTRPITIQVTKLGEGKDPMGGYRAGVAAEFAVKRSDFGMNQMLEGIGDEVTLLVALEGTKE
jgi:polyisoprenoid-binding protein YceI